jgi:hypothetical protein
LQQPHVPGMEAIADKKKKHLAARNENGADCFDALFAKMKVYLTFKNIS